jgi:hypothetical protein
VSNPIHDRDDGKCVVHAACAAESVHHRNHRHTDDRPSNRVSVCGSGTTGAHGWIEAHWAAANAKGWTISKAVADPRERWVWYTQGPYGLPPGWYQLDDNDPPGFSAWPGSLLWQEKFGEEHEPWAPTKPTARGTRRR